MLVKYGSLEDSEKDFYRAANEGYSKEARFIGYWTGGHSFSQAKKCDNEYGLYNSGLICKSCNLELYFCAYLRTACYQIIESELPVKCIYTNESLITCKEVLMKRALW